MTADLRAEIWRKYARLGPSGLPSRCHLARTGWNPRGKVIFRTESAAARAAAELVARGLGMAMDVYLCPHSTGMHRPHFHLTKAEARGPR